MKKLTVYLLALLALSGCRLDFWRPEPVALSILGFNYTGRYIHTFSVNGQGGEICTKLAPALERRAVSHSGLIQSCLSMWRWNGRLDVKRIAKEISHGLRNITRPKRPSLAPCRKENVPISRFTSCRTAT